MLDASAPRIPVACSITPLRSARVETTSWFSDLGVLSRRWVFTMRPQTFWLPTICKHLIFRKVHFLSSSSITLGWLPAKNHQDSTNDTLNQIIRPWHSAAYIIIKTCECEMRILTIYCLSAKYSFSHLALARFAFHISHLVSSLRFAHEEAKQLAFFFYAGSDPAYFVHCRRIYPALFDLWLLTFDNLKTLQIRKILHIFMRPPCIHLATLLLISHIRHLFLFLRPNFPFSNFNFQFPPRGGGGWSWDDCQNDTLKPLIINLTFPDFWQRGLFSSLLPT